MISRWEAVGGAEAAFSLHSMAEGPTPGQKPRTRFMGRLAAILVPWVPLGSGAVTAFLSPSATRALGECPS